MTGRAHAAIAWIDDGRARAAEDPAPLDYSFADRPSGRVMYRVDYLHDKGQPASLELLGAPEMLGIAESLCGPDFVPTYESLVFKNEGDGAPIPWHQDAIHPRRQQLVPLALAEHARAHPASDQFRWRPSPELQPVLQGDAEAELRLAHVVHSPMSWCSAGDVPIKE